MKMKKFGLRWGAHILPPKISQCFVLLSKIHSRGTDEGKVLMYCHQFESTNSKLRARLKLVILQVTTFLNGEPSSIFMFLKDPDSLPIRLMTNRWDQ